MIRVALAVATLLLALAATRVQAQQSAFTIADPGATSSAFRLDGTASHPAVPTLVPRLVGPEPARQSPHDSQTGAKIEEFGTAYFYANPLYGTYQSGNDGVGPPQGALQGGPLSATISFVVARFGGPPPPLPPLAGIDPAPALPDLALICYALNVDSASFPDSASAQVIDLAMHGMGRARMTRIDIAPRRPLAGAAAGQAMLRQVALALVHQGVHPAAILVAGRRVLLAGALERGAPVPGHVVSLRLVPSPSARSTVSPIAAITPKR